jgi:predicted  nucleic acid-binding Zn-ribbon protein
MLTEITQLLKLQERDQRINHLQKDLKDIPNHQARAKAQLAGDLAAVEKATLRIREVELKIKSIELDIATRKTSIKRLQDQQFETRKNDEFQALGHEIQRYEKDVFGLEDKEIEQMEFLDEGKKALKAAQDKLGLTQARVNDELAQLDERVAGITARLKDLQAERAELAAPVDKAALELYTRLITRRGDSAVVPLENGICGGCHMKIVTSTIQDLRQSEHLCQCDSCGRILYLVE